MDSHRYSASEAARWAKDMTLMSDLELTHLCECRPGLIRAIALQLSQTPRIFPSPTDPGATR
jgi:hypothetical protein